MSKGDLNNYRQTYDKFFELVKDNLERLSLELSSEWMMVDFELNIRLAGKVQKLLFLLLTAPFPTFCKFR